MLATIFGIEACFSGSLKSNMANLALDKVVERLKGLKLTIRNAPMGQTGCDDGVCVFTGEPAVERVLIGRAY